METIEFKGKEYLRLQSEGYASQYALPFAKKVLKGCNNILDIGCMKLEWAYPGSFPVDLGFPDAWNAMNLPAGKWDAIHSSHMAEHFIGNVWEMFDYWRSCLKDGGILFLYLPHFEYQDYWHGWHNKKHIHHFTPEIFKAYFKETGWSKSFVTDGADLNGSFYAIATK